MAKPLVATIHITKLVNGGQGLGELADGRKAFVWNALPGETVAASLTKQRRSYAEGIATEILQPSPDRIEPREADYLATSPWQILDYAAESRAKRAIVEELFQQSKLPLPTFDAVSSTQQWHYRNKMEYSFWGDDDGLHLALYKRGSHGKQVVEGSALAMRTIDQAAGAIVRQLRQMQIWAGDLKTLVLRSSRSGQVAGALFVEQENFARLSLPVELQGLRVYYSNPSSPASVRTKLLYQLGDASLHDQLLGQDFTYDVDSFFQVNLDMFEQALKRIKEHIDAPVITDMYAGVGSIGLSVAHEQVQLIELDPATAAMANLNAFASNLKATLIEASTEKALDYITSDVPVIFDPPRSGLHPKVTAHVLEALPPKIAYLSCNPATQARDLALLQEKYTIEFFEAYNFFPRTPHIETLAVLTKR